MSPSMQMPAATSAYIPTSDAVDRHDYGVNKNRKAASTGGGRAWSEDEEVYLLQTRLQKMPYKHIAAHLKKTELACRLHYHQLSHGSNRRKRSSSGSSGSSCSTGGHSPIISGSIPSPIHEHGRSPSPLGSEGYASTTVTPTSTTTSTPMQLPGIMPSRIGGRSVSPRLPAILPKPLSMTLAPAGSPTAVRGYPTPLPDATCMTPQSAPLLSAAAFLPTPTGSAPRSAVGTGPATTSNGQPHLRLDCSAPSTSIAPTHPVEMARLQAIYAAHRATFWNAIAGEYGPGANPLVLEQAWRLGSAWCQTSAPTPITPGTSPEEKDAFYGVKGAADRTRISAILGIDANPRSPKEREMVRRMEAGSVAV